MRRFVFALALLVACADVDLPADELSPDDVGVVEQALTTPPYELFPDVTLPAGGWFEFRKTIWVYLSTTFGKALYAPSLDRGGVEYSILRRYVPADHSCSTTTVSGNAPLMCRDQNGVAYATYCPASISIRKGTSYRPTPTALPVFGWDPAWTFVTTAVARPQSHVGVWVNGYHFQQCVYPFSRDGGDRLRMSL